MIGQHAILIYIWTNYNACNNLKKSSQFLRMLVFTGKFDLYKHLT